MKVSTPKVAAADRDAVYLAQAAEPVYPDDYRKCSQICGAKIGEPCFSLSGRIVGGRPDGIRTPLDAPHKARKRRTKRVKS